MPQTEPGFYTLRDLTEMFGRSRWTINNWVKAGKLPEPEPAYLHLPMRWRREDIDELLGGAA